MGNTKPGKKVHSETEAILGRPPVGKEEAESGETNVKPKWLKYYRQLLKIRDYLQTQHNRMESGAAEYDPRDMMQTDAEAATDEADRDLAFGLASNYQEILEEVDAALGRIEAGTYGICELTGRPIPADRLKAVPWTRFAAEAEKQIEREGRAPMANALARPESNFESSARSEVPPSTNAPGEKEQNSPTPGENKED